MSFRFNLRASNENIVWICLNMLECSCTEHSFFIRFCMMEVGSMFLKKFSLIIIIMACGMGDKNESISHKWT